jgi:predicted TIM-barrel fold metal-dependent hydrolase
VAVIENGSTWLAPLLANMADVYKKMPQDFLEDPVEVIKRNIYVSPFWEEDLGAVADLIGVDQVLFGSDYPHPEGLAEPASYVDALKGLPDESIRKIMGGNLARLMNVDDAPVER